MQVFKDPFFHFIIDDYLTETEYDSLLSSFTTLKFYRKESDLFKINQSNALEIEFLKNKLNNIFHILYDERNNYYSNIEATLKKYISKKDSTSLLTEEPDKIITWIDLFASFYTPGCYLLCHDDMVEYRLFAFILYLEDCASGDLILYEKDCVTEHKRIKVKKNRLVVFEVSPFSYHEVDYTMHNRKTITGWYNTKEKEIKNKYTVVEIEEEIEDILHIEKNIIFKNESLSKHLTYNNRDKENHDEGVNENLNDTGINNNDIIINKIRSANIGGPFINRRLINLTGDFCIFKFKGLKLISSKFYYFRTGDYILLNDKVNNDPAEHDTYYDLFIVEDNVDINFVGEEKITLEIEKGITLINRENTKMYIERVETPFYLGHLTYVKENNEV